LAVSAVVIAWLAITITLILAEDRRLQKERERVLEALSARAVQAADHLVNPPTVQYVQFTTPEERDRHSALMMQLHKNQLEAEKKSEALFRRIGGEKAHALLSQIGVMLIVGSQGTEYYLRNERSFCVERALDHLRMCAVVPDVPLWDQLLGLKLIIENDEETFVQSAQTVFTTEALVRAPNGETIPGWQIAGIS